MNTIEPSSTFIDLSALASDMLGTSSSTSFIRVIDALEIIVIISIIDSIISDISICDM